VSLARVHLLVSLAPAAVCIKCASVLSFAPSTPRTLMGRAPSSNCRWAATAAPVLASEARSIEHHVLKAAGKVASKVTEISAVAEEAGAPNAAQISQVLAGILAATGLVGKGGGGAVRTW